VSRDPRDSRALDLVRSLSRPARRAIADYRLVSPFERAQERLRERLQRHEERRLLELARNRSTGAATKEQEPLVTVRVATYDCGPLIVERALSSILRQTYERLEVLVIGDCCDEPTERAVRSVRDPRVRFVNLPVRGSYPADRRLRWMVAGAAPMNAGLVLARGAWIAPCDDDDEFTDDHVERLLQKARDDDLEMVHSRALMEATPGSWWVTGGPRLAEGVAHGSVLYASSLRFFGHSTTSWRRAEPSDWNLWRRMRAAGVRIGFLDRITYVHYQSVHKYPELQGLGPRPSPLVGGSVPEWAASAPTTRHGATPPSTMR
jgi:hypothetical protein